MSRQQRRQQRRHADSLARTATLEMAMGVGDWRDTIDQMHGILADLQAQRDKHRTAEDELIGQMKVRLSRLEAVISHRESEYDRLQERFCALQDEMNGVP